MFKVHLWTYEVHPLAFFVMGPLLVGKFLLAVGVEQGRRTQQHYHHCLAWNNIKARLLSFEASVQILTVIITHLLVRLLCGEVVGNIIS